MLEILDIKTAMPAQWQSVTQVGDELALSMKDKRMYERFFGLNQIPLDPNQPLHEMTADAVQQLLTGEFAPDLVVHCHTLLSSGPARSDAAIPLKLFANSDAEIFSATMCHCASGVAVLEMVESILPENGIGLIIVGDKAFHPAVRLIKNTTIMGDGAVAMLVARRPGRFKYVASHTERLGQYAIITGRLGDETDTAFAAEYVDFTTRCIQKALVAAKLGVDDLRFVFPHNVNTPSWDQISDQLGVPRDRIYLNNVSRYAHTFGADPFLNLFDAEQSGELAPGDHVALVSVGLGATASCAILQVTDNPKFLN